MLKGAYDRDRLAANYEMHSDIQKRENTYTSPKPKSKNLRQIDDEFEDASFNDTDEDVKFSERDIRSPGHKSSHKSSNKFHKYQVDSPLRYNAKVPREAPLQTQTIEEEVPLNNEPIVEEEPIIESEPIVEEEPLPQTHYEELKVSQPRTGPSRRVGISKYGSSVHSTRTYYYDENAQPRKGPSRRNRVIRPPTHVEDHD